MELEDIELNEELLAKRHKELLTAINKLTNAISQNKESEIVKAIEKNALSMDSFITAIKSIKPPEVSINQNEVIVAINELSVIVKESIGYQKIILEELKKPRDGEFKVNKNNYGFIESVTFKSK